MDRSRIIFGNKISDAAYRKAVRTKSKFTQKFGDDSDTVYHLSTEPAPAISEMLGVRNIITADESDITFNEKSLIVGNIRMGFGHYRIAMAIASAAHSMGYEPMWLDLHSFTDATCGKIIEEQNRLYSLGSRLSQKSVLFNKLFWEPMNSEGFRKLTYNSSDQKTAELMTSIFREIPKNVPIAATHAWVSQAAVHAGMERVVNVIPDNWPMALHLSEGAVHTVQTPSSYIGYRALRGMDKKHPLKPMPSSSIVYTGHYVDHELVSNIEEDCRRRIDRAKNGKPLRWLMSVGGAGAQKDIFVAVIRRLLPHIRKDKAVLFINVGDHMNVWRELESEIPQMKPFIHEHLDDFGEVSRFCSDICDGEVSGIHAFCHSDIFAAVYSTNLLMRVSDILITKPSELSFYPVPKLMIKRVGGHEAWGAIRAAEVGDSTYECSTASETSAMISLIQHSRDIIPKMCSHILTAKKAGIYNGAYRVVELAAGKK